MFVKNPNLGADPNLGDFTVYISFPDSYSGFLSIITDLTLSYLSKYPHVPKLQKSQK